MKVLWFTNNSVNLTTSNGSGGWIQNLEKSICKNEEIQLYIVTRSNKKKIERIKNDKTIYYLSPDNRSIIKKRIDIIINKEPIGLFIMQYKKIIEEVKPDIIHVFGSEMEYGLVSSITNIPVIIQIQGILHPINYHLNRINIPFLKKVFTQNFIDLIKGNTFNNGLKIFKRRTKQEGNILYRSKYLIGRTDWDKNVSNLLAPDSIYFHCDEIIRNEYFSSNWLGNSNDTIKIVSTISNSIYKGHDTIISTCLELKKTNIPFEWHIIGFSNTESSFSLFYKKYQSLLKKEIIFHSKLQTNEIIQILQTSNVYVHPSHIENSSNSICEAMALGMPVIAIFTGGTPFIIENNKNGILVPDNDPYYLSSKIKEVARNRILSESLSECARNMAITRHNPEKIVSDLLSIYKTIIHV